MTISDHELDQRLQRWADAQHNQAPDVAMPDLHTSTISRHRGLLVAMSVALAAAAAVLIAVVPNWDTGSGTDRGITPGTGPTPTSAPMSTSASPRVWTWRGVSISTPPDWFTNAIDRCGSPTRDTVLIGPELTHSACVTAAPPPRGISWVDFEPWPGQVGGAYFTHATTDTIRRDGVSIERTTGIGASGPGRGRHAIVLDIADKDVEVRVYSPSAALARKLADSVHID